MRIEYPGAIYHVMSRGDRREDIFFNDVDRQDFLKTVAEACMKADFLVHAYYLILSHVESLSPGDGDAQRQFGRWNAVDAQQLHPAAELSQKADGPRVGFPSPPRVSRPERDVHFVK